MSVHLSTIAQFKRTGVSYDSGGNRSGGTYALAPGGGNELASGDSYTAIAYDAEGNLTSRTAGTTTTYAYDYRDRLVGSTAFTPAAGGTAAAPAGGATSAPAGSGPVPIYPGGGAAVGSPPRVGTQAGVGTGTTTVTTYTYDALDRRAATDLAGAITWTVWDGAQPYEDLADSGGPQTRFLQGDAVDAALAATDAAGSTRWYLGDRQGSVRDLAIAAGADAGHLAYDAFGDITAASANLNGAPAFAFDGMRLEIQTSLYYDRARFYSPSTGRFLTEDPSGFAGGDANLYRFVGNSPQNGADPSGLDDTDYILPFGPFYAAGQAARIYYDQRGVGEKIDAKLAATKGAMENRGTVGDDATNRAVDQPGLNSGSQPRINGAPTCDARARAVNVITNEFPQEVAGNTVRVVEAAGVGPEGIALGLAAKYRYKLFGAVGKRVVRKYVQRTGKWVDLVGDEKAQFDAAVEQAVAAKRGPSFGPGWKARPATDPAVQSGCEAAARQIKKLIVVPVHGGRVLRHPRPLVTPGR